MDNENRDYPLSEPSQPTHTPPPPPRSTYSPSPACGPTLVKRPGLVRRFCRWFFRSLLIMIFLGSVCANIIFLFSFMTGGLTVSHVYRDGENRFNQIALIDLGGPISMKTASEFRVMLNEAQRDKTVKGIIIVVNSPGGQVVPSDLMARYLKDFKKACPEKRVYTSIQQVSASGAYWATAATDKIFANKNAVVGSIGVIYMNVVVKNALDTIGVEPVVIKSSRSEFKDQGSPFRIPTSQERAKVLKQLDTIHQRFVTVVANGRDLSENEVWTLAKGDVYDGPESIENKLIDKIGTLDDVIDEMETDMSLKNCQVIRYAKQKTLSDLLAGEAHSLNDSLDLKKQAEKLLSEPRIQARWIGY